VSGWYFAAGDSQRRNVDAMQWWCRFSRGHGLPVLVLVVCTDWAMLCCPNKRLND
jgi:hypothetical protein